MGQAFCQLLEHKEFRRVLIRLHSLVTFARQTPSYIADLSPSALSFQAGGQNAVRMIRELIIDEINTSKNQLPHCEQTIKALDNIDIGEFHPDDIKLVTHPVADSIFKDYERLKEIYDSLP